MDRKNASDTPLGPNKVFSLILDQNTNLTQEPETTHLKGLLTRNIIRSTLPKTKSSQENKIVFEKFPGFLHIALDSIEKLPVNENISITLQAKSTNILLNSKEYESNDFIKIGEYMKVPILNKLQDKIDIVFSIYSNSSRLKTKVFESVLSIGNEDITDFQNKLVEKKIELSPIKSLFSTVTNSVIGKKDQNPILKFYCSFISNSEFEDSSKAPNSLLALGKWIIFRKYAFKLMFEGICNLKFEKEGFNWKRRHIKWFGFLLYVFDEKTNNLLFTIDLSDSEPSLELMKRNIIIFNIRGKKLSIEFNTTKELKDSTEAVYRLFPNIMRWV